MRNFKRLAVIAAVVAVVLLLLDFVLYPCTFIRNDIHAVTSGKYDDVYLGTSHGKMNIDPAEVEAVNGRSGHNLCVGGEYAMDVYFLARLMIEKGTAPERIIYEVSPDYFITEKEEGNNYLLFYHEFPASMAKLDYFREGVSSKNMRTWFFPWYEYPLSYELQKMKETVSRKWNKDFSAEGMGTDKQIYHENGYIERTPIDTSTLDPDSLKKLYIPYPEDLLPVNMEYLERLIGLCEDHQIELVALIPPIPKVTYDYFEDGYAALETYFSEYFAEKGVRFINFNSEEMFTYGTHAPEDYVDLDGHMNGAAARAFSAQLARVLDLPQEEWAVWEISEEDDWEDDDWEEDALG